MQAVTYAPLKAALLCAALTLFSTMRIHAEVPSKLIEDSKGVLWVARGDNQGHPGALAAALSQRPPYMVIYVSTTDEYEDRAIAHARGLAKWFGDQPDGPDKVPVVALKSKYNTHFYIEICGIHYTHDEFAPEGKMGPQETYRVREDALLTYRARVALQREGATDFMPVTEVTVVRNQD